MENKKQQVLEAIYSECEKNNDFVFDNIMVKAVSAKIGFGNPFDVTKLDNKSKLPASFIDRDIAVIHLGSGYHKFIHGIDNVYHDFESIDNNIVKWQYRKSLLNQYNSSESNILSVANNQRILHHFLFGKDKEFEDIDIFKRPKTYFPHRTKTSFDYSLNNNIIHLHNIQIEIDLTIEYNGVIGVFEAKNGKPDSFSVYQIYHPFLYYYNANNDSSIKGKIKNIYSVYVVREREGDKDILKLWAYTFENPLDITSIKYIKSCEYELIKQN